MSYFFTSESVSEGHPDKVCDAISDNLLDFYLSHDSKARTAIEVLATTNKVIISGEISSSWH
ncbi:MAG: methionine adenosyltransferase, partial [Alphaproteobacteria bacterium]|nr:methionine adenosyltransferase [Alphaproteobacteria bacterium]